jgi:sugar phosphate isomerase/epimerase
MWRRHPDNDTPEAWRDMIAAMAEAASLAEAHGVTLAVEPEVANVVDSAQKARRMLDEVRSPALKICIDGANVFHLGELPRQREILDEAFQLLGDDIVLAHAKDLDHDGAAGHLAAGHGLLDYDHYLTLLHQIGFDGAIVLHGLSEAQIDGCVAMLRAKIARIEG